MTRIRRRTDPQVAIARAEQRADSYDNAAPRRPINGHTADCPNREQGPMRRCAWCRAETLERGRQRINGQLVPDRSVLAIDQRPASNAQPGSPACVRVELRQCTTDGCYRPTDHPTGTCERCQEASNA